MDFYFKCTTFNLDYFKQSWTDLRTLYKNCQLTYKQEWVLYQWQTSMAPHGLCSEPSFFQELSLTPWGKRAALTACSLSPVQAPHLPLLQSHRFQRQHRDRQEPARELLLFLHLSLHLLGEPGCLWPEVSCSERGGLAALRVFCSPGQPGMFQPLCKILPPFQSGHCSREEWEHGHVRKPAVSQLLYCKWSPGPHCCSAAFTGDDGMFPQCLFSSKLYVKAHSWIGIES